MTSSILGSSLVLPSSLLAQDAVSAPATTPGSDKPAEVDAGQSQGGEIVVTGTIFRRTSKETTSPVTVLSSANLAKAGITTVSDAVRSISSDNSGSVSTAFSNGFGAGASGVSLRGLTVNSTLVLFDGIRAAYYPLADDGQRSFVDLNTIPDEIVDHIDVLKDGASSTYGADAIGGVVNVVTKKQITGVSGVFEGGVSQRKDTGHQRFSVTAGHGDLQSDGWNVYANFEYQHDSALKASDRGFPYNTRDLSSIGGRNRNPGAVSPGQTTVGVVTPRNADGTFDPAGYQVLGGGCGSLIAHTGGPGNWCEQDLQKQYGYLQPDQTRIGGTLHATARVGENAQAYAIATFYQNRTYVAGAPAAIEQVSPVDTTQIVLPSHLSNGALNPNNPFAASGRDALILYRFGDIKSDSTYRNRAYRFATGINGTFGTGWNYSFDATAMRSSLDITQNGYLNLAGLQAAIADGSYNFVNPSLNSEAVRKAIAPTVYTTAKSDLYAWQKGLLPLTLAAMEGAIRANGAAVEQNLRAIGWGRLAAVDLALAESKAGLSAAVPAAETLGDLVAQRTTDLIGYQNELYAARYADLVEQVRAGVAPFGERGTAIVEAVACNAYRLMAYKDEYEVARLYGEPAFRQALGETFSDTKRVSVWLAPPLLSRVDPSTGRPAKRKFGPWIFRAFALLAAAKGLRGTWADPFGRTAERRAERAMIEAYFTDIDDALDGMTGEMIEPLLKLAALPAEVRGFGPVKEKAIADHEVRREAVLRELTAARVARREAA